MHYMIVVSLEMSDDPFIFNLHNYITIIAFKNCMLLYVIFTLKVVEGTRAIGVRDISLLIRLRYWRNNCL